MNPKPFNSAIIIQQENEETVCVCVLPEGDGQGKGSSINHYQQLPVLCEIQRPKEKGLN